MASAKIWIDGIDYSSDTLGLDVFEVEYSLNSENQTLTKAISNNFTFQGKAYEYLKSVFIDSDDGQDAIVQVLIEAGCCNKEYNFIINSELLTWCPGECSIDSAVVTDNNRTRFYDILNSKVWFTDFNGVNFKDGLTFYRIRYGTDNSTQLIIWIVLSIFGAVFLSVFTFASAVINAFNQLPVVPNVPNFAENLTWQAQLLRMVGGENFHTAVLIRDIFERNCLQAGGTFSSTIFQSGTYSETALHCALTDGTNKDEQPGDTNFLDIDSLHILTPIQLAELLKPVFNLDYRVITDANGDPVLKMERKDYFDASLITVADIDDQVEEGNAEGACYKFYKSELPALSRYTYATDSLDVEGNRMLTTGIANNQNKVSYFDMVEHNPANAFPSRKGERIVSNEFAPARFQNDIKNRSFFDGIRDLIGHNEHLVMERGTASNMKLLILKPLTDPLDSKVIDRASASESGKRDYNWPLNYSENYEQPELIQQFHFIDHPDYSEGIKYVIDEWVWHPDNFCDAVETIDINGVDELLESTINGVSYAGKPDSVTVRFGSGSILFKNVKMKKV